ncbi:hypothetical protein SeLEV6574_g02059 [Synchytrium endobioticum]|uniref:Uncharacterized protein n=1 Tax=Synchytrium endobioticum TaxID=286115 RepID=A0A507DAA2_9FUNG|nr:hypothetical protein SeLEV6574_g02059 [Synchytrium endobioticum]
MLEIRPPEDELALKGKNEKLAELIQRQDEFEPLDGLRATVSKFMEQFICDEEAAIELRREELGLEHDASFSPLPTTSLGAQFMYINTTALLEINNAIIEINTSAWERARMSATARNKFHMFKQKSIIFQTHKTPDQQLGQPTNGFDYDDMDDKMNALVPTGWQVCRRMQDVLKPTIDSLFMQLGISKHAQLYGIETKMQPNILYCFLYELAFAERPRPFKRV